MTYIAETKGADKYWTNTLTNESFLTSDKVKEGTVVEDDELELYEQYQSLSGDWISIPSDTEYDSKTDNSITYRKVKWDLRKAARLKKVEPNNSIKENRAKDFEVGQEVSTPWGNGSIWKVTEGSVHVKHINHGNGEDVLFSKYLDNPWHHSQTSTNKIQVSQFPNPPKTEPAPKTPEFIHNSETCIEKGEKYTDQPNKADQKAGIIEVMKLDEQDGLYEEQPVPELYTSPIIEELMNMAPLPIMCPNCEGIGCFSDQKEQPSIKDIESYKLGYEDCYKFLKSEGVKQEQGSEDTDHWEHILGQTIEKYGLKPRFGDYDIYFPALIKEFKKHGYTITKNKR